MDDRQPTRVERLTPLLKAQKPNNSRWLPSVCNILHLDNFGQSGHTTARQAAGRLQFSGLKLDLR
jgi:hypothetical protein